MSKAEGVVKRVRCAVLVDADNMFLGLQAISPEAAAVFVSDPGRWVRWLRDLRYPQVGANVMRDLLVRVCYLNPSLGGSWRSSFVQAGFQVVDCPTLTNAGKNSADIHMVIAMLDLLAHPTHFDEIIVMSSDADFTPALLRIRAHDRRTVVVTSGPHAPVLQASCDHLVPAATFACEVLADAVAAPVPPSPEGSSPAAAGSVIPAVAALPVKKTTVKQAPAKKSSAKKTSVKKAVAAPATALPAAQRAVAKKTGAKKAAAKQAPVKKAVPAAAKKPAKKAAAPKTVGLTDDARARTGDEVRRLVSESAIPVVLGKIAEPVRSALGPELAPSWDGARGLKKLLQQMDLAGITVSDSTPGYVYDPSRHQKP